MPLNAGTRLGPYEIRSLIGAGGMGEVYRALDTRLNRSVAIKVLPSLLSGAPEFRERFDREARTISQLSHPNICTLHDVGREGDVDFLVMEYLEGETLAARLANGALPLSEALRVATETAGRANGAPVVDGPIRQSRRDRRGAWPLCKSLARSRTGGLWRQWGAVPHTTWTSGSMISIVPAPGRR